jgi:hypothetical protein
LADRHQHRIFFHDRIAIAKLAGVRALGHDLGVIFHQIIAHQPRVPGRPLAGQDISLGAHQVARVIGQSAEDDPPLALLHAPAQAILHRLRLLEDLLEHVMLVVPQLVLFELVLELRDDRRDVDVVDRHCPEALGLQQRHLVVVEVNHLRRVLDDRRSVRCYDVLALPNADDQRRPLARHHQRIGLVLADDRDPVSPLHLVQRRLHRPLQQRRPGRQMILRLHLVVKVADQHRQNFRVGLAGEFMSLLAKEFLERGVIFDDAVVNQGDPPAVVRVRVGIALGRRAVGRPAGMGHADLCRRQRLLAQSIFKHRNPPDGPADVQVVRLIYDRHPRRIVTPVFQSLEPLDQERLGDLASDVGDDSAHAINS